MLHMIWAHLSLAHSVLCSCLGITFERVITREGVSFWEHLGPPEALRSDCRKREGLAFYVQELKKGPPREEEEGKMVGARGPWGSGCLSHAEDVFWRQAVAWDGPRSVDRGKGGSEPAPRWCVDGGLEQQSYLAVCSEEVLPGVRPLALGSTHIPLLWGCQF